MSAQKAQKRGSRNIFQAIELVRGRVTLAQESLSRLSGALDTLEEQLQDVPEENLEGLDEELEDLLFEAGAGGVSVDEDAPSFVPYSAMPDDDMSFSRNGCSTTGELIRHLRQERGWNQGELAHRAGVSLPTAGNIERGKVNGVNVETAERIARALDWPVAELFFSVRVSELGRPAGTGSPVGKRTRGPYRECSDCGNKQEIQLLSCDNCGKTF